MVAFSRESNADHFALIDLYFW